MLGKLFKSKKVMKSNNIIIEKISKMNLSEMRSYVKNSIKDFELSEDGLELLMNKLITKDEKTKKYYINSDDMSSKKKKAFDLIILISNSKKITVTTVEQIQKFVKIYKEIIVSYDKEFKEIYLSRFEDAITIAIANVNTINLLKNKMKVLGE